MIIKKKIFVFLTAIFVILVSVTNASSHTVLSSKPAWMSQFAWAVGICETGKGNKYPDFSHRSGDLEGFVGWRNYTWDMDKVGVTSIDHAYQASPRIQNKVAAVSFKRHRNFGCISNGGYKYWQ